MTRTSTTFQAATAKLTWLVMLLTLNVSVLPIVQAAEVPAEKWVNVPVKNDPVMQNLNIPADAATKGMWSGVFNWPMNGLHNMVLADGKVLTFGTTANGGSQEGRLFDVWDSSVGFGANSHQSSYQNQQQDSFCATAAYLSDGTMLVTGGNGNNGGNGKGSTIYNPVTNTRQTAAAVTALPRWYSTMITLPDSRKLVMGGMQPYTEGMWQDPNAAIANGLASMTPEVYENNQWRSLLGANSRDAFGPDFLRTSFPHAFVAPNGQVFGISADKMWYLDPNGNQNAGAMTYVANFKRGYGNMADPVNVGALSVALMYDVGKVMQVGGNGGNNGDGFPASNMATSVDLNNGQPVLTELPRMHFPRRYGNGVVLANGEVVITGGTRFGNNAGGNEIYEAETWNPESNTWTIGARASTIRVYHSITSLLPNGAILSTGGGTPGPVLNLNAEVYYPPYLFNQEGNGSVLAARPVIKAISGLTYAHGDTIQLDMATANPMERLALLGLSNGTHSFNQGQRRIPLTFTQNDFRLTAQIPNANLTPPGYYQVVALNANGVPSYGAIVAIGQNVAPPNVTVTPYTPPDLTGEMAVLVLNAGGTGSYSVTALNGYTYRWDFGDGSPSTTYSSHANATHTYTQAGVYIVTLSAKNTQGIVTNYTWVQAVSTAKTTQTPTSDTQIVTEPNGRIWTVNPDNDTVSVLSANNALIKEIIVGLNPQSVAIAPNGHIWIANKDAATISIVSSSTLAVAQTIHLPLASQPHGLIFSANGASAYVVLEATGQVVKLDNNGAQVAVVNVGAHARHIANTADSQTLLVSRFITPPLPGESTANINTSNKGGEVVVVNAAGSMAVSKTITLRHSDKVDNEIQGSGIPNYLAAPVISPDGTSAWLPSKQDNIKRGVARSGQNLDFQNTVRAISSNINMVSLAENDAKRVDHDNASVASAALYHPNGVYLFVALETSRQVAVLDAIKGTQLFRIDVGRAPQGLALSAEGNTLYVKEFMDRSVSAFDLKPLTQLGQLVLDAPTVTYTVGTEKLAADVVLGKQFFYDAKDTRLARDGYMSCASCHNAGDTDGRVWDLTGFGEGLRNTIALKGRAAMGHGFLHWSTNFDELQDFEGQIRTLSGGTGLMTDAQFNTGSRNQPLGDKKAGVSEDLDHLARYVASLNTFAKSPYRNANGTLTSSAIAGKTVFTNTCASCHSGNHFTNSRNASTLENNGTMNALSGQRLNGALLGIDVPTLRDVWATAPYLHNGSAATLAQAVQAHNNFTLSATDLANVVAFVQQIGSEEEGVGGPENLAPSATLATSHVSPWENLAAVNNGTTHTSSADKNGGAYGNWRGAESFGETNWVSFTWDAAKTLNAFEVYWWHDGNGVVAPNAALVEYWNGNAWIKLGDVGVALNQYNRFEFDDVVTTRLRVVMSSTAATGILEAKVWSSGTPPLAENQPPLVNISTPTANVTLSQGDPYAITASASDPDGSIVKVEIYNYDGLLSTLTNAPYAIQGSTERVPVGVYSITAKAYDDKGAVTTSAPVLITVDPTGNTKPTVSITTPSENITLIKGDPYIISAVANDADGSISKVEFYNHGSLLQTLTSAPYTLQGTTESVPVGVYSITAKAYDNRGDVATTAPVVITVKDSP